MPANDTQSRNPEPKVSDKARELAERINKEMFMDKWPTLIQNELRELLEAGRDAIEVRRNFNSDDCEWVDKFAAILSKWEAPK